MPSALSFPALNGGACRAPGHGPEPASGCVSGHFDPCPGHPSGHPEEGKDAARLAAIKSRLRGMMRKGG